MHEHGKAQMQATTHKKTQPMHAHIFCSQVSSPVGMKHETRSGESGEIGEAGKVGESVKLDLVNP